MLDESSWIPAGRNSAQSDGVLILAPYPTEQQDPVRWCHQFDQTIMLDQIAQVYIWHAGFESGNPRRMARTLTIGGTQYTMHSTVLCPLVLRKNVQCSIDVTRHYASFETLGGLTPFQPSHRPSLEMKYTAPEDPDV
mmetsp:Transcript_46391/g.145535  ORF Transcript_46391/g.145535 Transcript_46391/m.145535 type:complete len:137 (-) Transcript_46391:108-518(-)